MANEGYVVCKNDYPLEIVLMSENAVKERVAKYQKKFDKDRTLEGRKTYVWYQSCPVVRKDSEGLST